MYALHAAIQIMEADPTRLQHRNSFNIASMSFDPEIIANNIRKYIPDFQMEYKVDPLRQAIADSWPNSLDDTCAREEWDWKPTYDLDTMTKDQVYHHPEELRKKSIPGSEPNVYPHRNGCYNSRSTTRRKL